MIDIHTHLLPALDDGARNMDDAVSMVRMAAKDGVTDIIATPHANLEFSFNPEAVEQALLALQRAIGPSPRLHYGCELHITPENIDNVLRNPPLYALARRAYVLVEFSDLAVPSTAGHIFASLQAARLYPIIAHPERNPILRDKWPQLHAWIRQGCFLQLTSDSLTGRFGRHAQAAATEWLDRGAVHFIASDAHDRRHRPPALRDSLSVIEKYVGPAGAQTLLTANPQAVLEGRALATVLLRPRRRRWFWKR